MASTKAVTSLALAVALAVGALIGHEYAVQVEVLPLQQRVAELEGAVIDGELSVLDLRFSPRGGAASQVSYWISRANRSVHVLIFSFTLDDIGDALLDAHGRGIDVRVVFEKGQVSRYSEYFRLAAAGVPVRNDTNPDHMHNKVAIVDGHIVLTGSFNWSASAEDDNNENLIVIRSAELAAAYESEFQRIWSTGR